MDLNLIKTLRWHHACEEAIEWLGKRTLQQAWGKCPRGDWMFWLWATFDHNPPHPLMLAMCECVRLVLPVAPGNEARVCVETIESWCRGKATHDQVRKARLEISKRHRTSYDSLTCDSFKSAAANAAVVLTASMVYGASSSAMATTASTAIISIADAIGPKKGHRLIAEIVRKHRPIAPQLTA